MSAERTGFKSIPWEKRSAKEKAPRKLIKPTQQVVNNALRLVKQGEMDCFGRKEVVVMDLKTGQSFSIMDVYAKARNLLSGSAVDLVLERGLFINPITSENELVIHEEMGIQVPGLPELVTQDSIYLLRGIHPRAMRKVAKQLERAEIVK